MLTCSAPEISLDEITDYPVAERFMKLPIENYLKLMDITPGRAQIALINAINSPDYRFIVGCLSRRQGKTYISNIIAQVVSLMPDMNVLLMAPNYSLTQISWELQRSLINKFDLEITKNNAKDKVIELSNGSTVRMGSVTQADSVVGRSYDLILFDEAALSDAGRDAFNLQLRPTLDKPGSKAIFISTPRGIHNYFKDFYDRGYDDAYPKWVSIHADYLENTRAEDEDIIDAKNSMSRAEFRQEYMADFLSFSGRIWDMDTELCVQDLSIKMADEEWMRSLDFIAGIDIGFKDPTAFVVIAYEQDTGKYYIMDEFQDNQLKTSEQAEQVLKLEAQYGLDLIFIDSAAAQTRFDWANDYNISTSKSKKSKLDGIAYVASIIDNNNLIVDESCLECLKTIDQYRWDERDTLTKERPLRNGTQHMADAIRYALYTYSGTHSMF